MSSTPELKDAAFRVSSYSGENGECVSVALVDADE
jgi:hypothetical protein